MKIKNTKRKEVLLSPLLELFLGFSVILKMYTQKIFGLEPQRLEHVY